MGETNSTVKENNLAKRIVKGKERGQPCAGKYTVVEYTLRVKRSYRIVLWFMGTVEESRML